MAISRRRFLAGGLTAGALGLLGCAHEASVHRQRWYYFGTLVDVTVVHADARRVAHALQRVSALFGDIHRNLHAWRPGELQRINHAIAVGEAVSIAPSTVRMIADIQDQHVRSGGAFNPAVGELIGLWGFHDDELPTGRPPSRKRIDELVDRQPSPLDIDVSGGRLISRNRHVQLDLGGYGKGYALDAGMALFREAGLTDVIINAGGDLNVSGRQNRRAWRVGIRDPGGHGAMGYLQTAGSEAVYTSGSYERYLDVDGKRYAHIIDPRDGMPVDDIVSATVVDSAGTRADAAATALAVAGRQWRDVAEFLGVREAMVIDSQGGIALTTAMADRVSLDARTRRQVTVG